MKIRHLTKPNSAFYLCYDRTPYRIQNCFSTISAKILANHYYFRDFWRILWCKSLWIINIFAIISDVSVALIVTVMSAMPNHNWSDFLRDLIVELPTCSQILVTFLVIIFVSLPLLFPNFGFHFCTLIFAKAGDSLFTSIFSTLPSYQTLKC